MRVCLWRCRLRCPSLPLARSLAPRSHRRQYWIVEKLGGLDLPPGSVSVAESGVDDSGGTGDQSARGDRASEVSVSSDGSSQDITVSCNDRWNAVINICPVL